MKSLTLKLTLGLLFCLMALLVPNTTIMAYSDNNSLIEEIAEAEVLALIDDESVHFQSLQALVDAAGDEQSEHYAVAGRHLNRLDKARSNADHLIDAYLISYNPVPLNPVPPLVQKISNDLTIYHLYQRRMREDIPDGIRLSYKASLDSLRELQKGFIKASESPSPDTQQMRINKRRGDRVFTDERLSAFD